MRWLLATLLLAIPGLATAQETVTLKFPPQAKGDVHRVNTGMQQSVRMLRLDLLGNELGDRSSSVMSQLNYTDEYLDVDKGQVNHYRRRFDTALETVNDSAPSLLAIHGKAVVVDHRGEARKVSWEDGEPLSDGVTLQLEEALKEGKDKLGELASFDPLPTRAVKVGDSWPIDVNDIVKDCEAKQGCKLTGATGTGTLREVYDSPKGKCAKVEVHIQVPLRTINNGGKVFELNDGSGTELDAVYEFALGTESHYTSDIRLRFLAAGITTAGDGTATRLRVESTVNMKEQRSSTR